ncbi:MAG TPA: protein-glutamate O-methyltransferase CheR [Nitrospirota bacterium]
MLTDEEFSLFKVLIYDESGMYLADTKKDFLENRLLKRMRATNAMTPYWYYRHLLANRRTELLILLDSLTINETSFFRNEPQIELFRNVILPGVIERRKKEDDRKLRFWSAGCSTGEEPYTIAMVLLDALPNAHAWDIRIFASDISQKALAAAQQGVYSSDKVRETVSPAMRARFFQARGEVCQISEAAQKLVAFDYHNLKHENGRSGLDVIFCRNVMIYFDEDEQKRLVNKFHASLSPSGYLLLGHAESLHGRNLNFRFLHDNKGTAYQKKG